MICDRLPPCPRCNDPTIHQTNRQIWESSSGLGQYVADNLARDFWYLDIDAVVMARSTGIMRVIEHKPRGRCVSPGQRVVLSILSRALDQRPGSSVWVVESDPPYSDATVRRVTPVGPFDLGPAYDLVGDQWSEFLRARPVSTPHSERE